MITKAILKEYVARNCPHLAYLMMNEKSLLDFYKKLIETKMNPKELIEASDSEDEDGVAAISPYDYFSESPLVLTEAINIYKAKYESDSVSRFIDENEDLQEISRLSMRYFLLRYGNAKRADTVDGSLDGETIQNQQVIEANTRRLMKDLTVKVILEGQISVDVFRARYDALIREKDGFRLIEVKGSPNIYKKEEAPKGQTLKNQFLLDLGFQYYVYKLKGLPLNRIGFMRINKAFTRTDDVYPLSDKDLLNFFKEDEIIRYNKEDSIPFKDYFDQKLYLKNESDVDFIEKIDELVDIHNSKTKPKQECKYACRKGGVCPLLDSCFLDIDDKSIIRISCNGTAGGKYLVSQDLLDNLHYSKVNEIPTEYLDQKYPKLTKPSDKNKDYFKRNMARLQIDYALGEFKNKHTIEINGMKRILRDYFGKTLIFFDFESFQYAIPLANNIHAWEQICCQYSMHICAPDYDINKHNFTLGEGGKIKHYEYLGNPKEDLYNSPDLPLIETLKKQLDEAKVNPFSNDYVVIVYNSSFEGGRLKEMAQRYPQHKDFCLAFRDRIVDLYDFFTCGYWYHQDFGASLSLKTTQPVLMHDEHILSWYKDMPNDLSDTLNYKKGIIKNGGIALSIYQTLLRLSIQNKNLGLVYDDLRKGLLAYCKIDSWGTVVLYDTIVKVVDKIEKGTIDLDVDLKNRLI